MDVPSTQPARSKSHPTRGTGPGKRRPSGSRLPKRRRRHRRPRWARRLHRSLRSRGLNPKLVAGAAILVVIVGAALGVGLFTAAESSPEPADPAASTTPADPDAPVSTPPDQWRQGEYPELYQTDAAWAEVPYGAGTIRNYGCGPTTLAMVYVGLTGKTDQDPVSLAKLAEDSGYLEGGETTSRLMVDGADQLGLVAREFPVGNDELMAELEAGHPVIANLVPGDFTQVGHYIALVGLDGEGNVVIRDPNSPEHTHRTWSPFQLLRQTRFLWTYDVK